MTDSIKIYNTDTFADLIKKLVFHGIRFDAEEISENGFCWWEITLR